MLTDRYGLALSTTSTAARDAYVQASDLLLSFYPGAPEAFARAVAADPGFALAHAGQARSLQVWGDMPGAASALAGAQRLTAGLTEREASHIAFFALVLSGPTEAALAGLRVHLAAWPRDALMLSTCTSPGGLIGVSGRAGLKREQADLMDWLAPHYGDDWWFTGHHAFALAETGQLAAARSKVEQSLEQNRHNAWAAHTQAHLHYEYGDTDAARAFLQAWLPEYPRTALYHGHLSWHLALSELAAGDAAAAFAMYAAAIAPAASTAVPRMTLIDATAFLWRAELAGHPGPAAAWREVHGFAHRLFPQAGDHFADWHVVLADAATGDGAALEARVRQMEDLARSGRYASGPVVPALARGFAAFQRQDYAAAVDAMAPVYSQRDRAVGSLAQTDLIEFTLLKAYLLDGRLDEVRGLLRERRGGSAVGAVAGLALAD